MSRRDKLISLSNKEPEKIVDFFLNLEAGIVMLAKRLRCIYHHCNYPLALIAVPIVQLTIGSQFSNATSLCLPIIKEPHPHGARPVLACSSNTGAYPVKRVCLGSLIGCYRVVFD